MIKSLPFKHELLFSINAENLQSTILPKTKGDHLYYIINLSSGIVKFGISNDVRKRMIVHVGNFCCYGGAEKDNLIISCSQDSVINAKDNETRLITTATNHPLFKPSGGREFFSYLGLDTSALDVFFSDFISTTERRFEDNFQDKKLRNKSKAAAPFLGKRSIFGGWFKFRSPKRRKAQSLPPQRRRKTPNCCTKASNGQAKIGGHIVFVSFSFCWGIIQDIVELVKRGH